MTTLRIAFALFFGALSTFAMAQRALVPIIDYKDVSIATSTGKPVTAEQVRDAIAAAGKRMTWDMAYTADGGLVGTLVVANKHTISVNIAVSPSKYSVTYRSSINMKYGVGKEPNYGRSGQTSNEGLPVIHPAYNQWVQSLVTAMDAELRKL
jgi:hypothetical protein